ncbi:MAG: DUF5678 domain-containing protein [Candidatus Thorarchaeota archaeon]
MNKFDIIMSMSDLGEHIGKWVALVDKEIVATVDSGKTVFREAKKKYPDREPFIMKVPRNEVMLL